MNYKLQVQTFNLVLVLKLLGFKYTFFYFNNDENLIIKELGDKEKIYKSGYSFCNEISSKYLRSDGVIYNKINYDLIYPKNKTKMVIDKLKNVSLL